jgi:uncharacterized protein
MKIRKIEFPCSDLTLEGLISRPAGEGPFGAVVVCHPHPLFGGDMFNPVVSAVCARLAETGLAWLKFNFRGVGRSGGRHGGGSGEREDARAAVAFAEKQPWIHTEKIGICGYSFGSGVAFAAAAEDPRIRAVAGISPFIPPPGLLDRCFCPKLFVAGTGDGWIDVPGLKRQVALLPGPRELFLLPGSDHFWSEGGATMAEKVAEFFSRNLGAGP